MTEKDTRLVVILYSHMVGRSLMRLAQKYDIPVVLSVANKLGKYRVDVKKYLKVQLQCKRNGTGIS